MSARASILAAASAIVPCNYGDAKFTRAAPHYQQGGGTSCTFGPAFFMFAAGCRDARIVNFDGGPCRFDVGQGVAKLWAGSRKAGCWVEAGGGRRPKPGDLYLLHGPVSGGQWAPSSEHVGTVRSSTGNVWTFDDFGQTQTNKDPHPGFQCARRVSRTWDGAHLGSAVPGGASRILGGWIDADALTITAAPLFTGGGAPDWVLPAVLLTATACAVATLDED